MSCSTSWTTTTSVALGAVSMTNTMFIFINVFIDRKLCITAAFFVSFIIYKAHESHHWLQTVQNTYGNHDEAFHPVYWENIEHQNKNKTQSHKSAFTACGQRIRFSNTASSLLDLQVLSFNLKEPVSAGHFRLKSIPPGRNRADSSCLLMTSNVSSAAPLLRGCCVRVVSSHVIFPHRRIRKSFPAAIAGVRLLTCVSSHVNY